MNRIVLAALLLATSVVSARAQPVTLQIIEGVALRLPERTEVYRERHAIGALSHRIEYRAPDGFSVA